MARRAVRPRRRDIFPIGFSSGGGPPPPDPPVITSSLTASGTVGVAFSYTITATNSPTSLNATGLPDGLSVNSGTGAITGTPTAAATTNITISATNAGGTDTETLVLTVAGTGAVLSGESAVFSDIFVWLKVTTDTATGTLFSVVVPAAATAPSGAQIAAGTDGSNNAATAAANVAIASSGVKTLQSRGLTANTAYKVYATHQTAGPTYSAVVNVAFTSDVLIIERAVSGASPGLTAGPGCAAFSGGNLSRADPYGGTNACRFMDANDAVSNGAVTMTLGSITFHNGINKFCITHKYTSGAAHLRQFGLNVTVVLSTHWNTSTLALGTNAGWSNREIFTVGSGWAMWTGQLDMAGADVTGGFQISKGAADNSATVGIRDGTHQADIYNIRITRAAA